MRRPFLSKRLREVLACGEHFYTEQKVNSYVIRLRPHTARHKSLIRNKGTSCARSPEKIGQATLGTRMTSFL